MFKDKRNSYITRFKKDGLRCWINLKTGELDDPKKICKDVSNIGHYAPGSYDLRINQDSDLDYVMFLIKQGYRKQV